MEGLAGDERFAVLSIDGGGVRGIFVAAVLASLERDTGTKITDHFDLIVGTSTGGIIALGLGAGMSPEEILALYVDNVDSIFPAWRRSILARPLSLVRAKYKAGWAPAGGAGGVRGQAAVRQHRPAGDPVVQHRRERGVLVQDPASRATAPRLERADVAGRHGDHGGADLLPGLLPARRPRPAGGRRRMGEQPVDGRRRGGGLDVRAARWSEIRLLSLGTTVAAAYRPRKLDRGGLIQWVRSPNVAQVLMAGQSLGAFTAAEHLLGRGRAFRLNPPAPEALAKLDTADSRDLLAAAAHHSRDFCPTFADRVRLAPARTVHTAAHQEGHRRMTRFSSQALDELLGTGISQLDITPAERRLAVARYTARRPVAGRALGHRPVRRAGLPAGIDAAGHHHP